MKKLSLSFKETAILSAGIVSGAALTVLSGNFLFRTPAPQAPVSTDMAITEENKNHHTLLRCWLGSSEVLHLEVNGPVVMSNDGKWHFYNGTDSRPVTVDYNCLPTYLDEARKDRQIGITTEQRATYNRAHNLN